MVDPVSQMETQSPPEEASMSISGFSVPIRVQRMRHGEPVPVNGVF